MVDLRPVAKLETSGPGIVTVVDPDENIIWKNSAWLGTGIMIDRATPLTDRPIDRPRETPIAKIIGQMS